MKSSLQLLYDALKAMGADGLAINGCGCGLDDLIPCDSMCRSCMPARWTKPEMTSPDYDPDCPEGYYKVME